MEIKPRIEGFINKKIIGIRFDQNIPQRPLTVTNDQVTTNLLLLFTSQKLCNISDWTSCPITAEIEKRDNSSIGKIEVGIEEIDGPGIKTLFDTVCLMSEIMRSPCIQ